MSKASAHRKRQTQKTQKTPHGDCTEVCDERRWRKSLLNPHRQPICTIIVRIRIRSRSRARVHIRVRISVNPRISPSASLITITIAIAIIITQFTQPRPSPHPYPCQSIIRPKIPRNRSTLVIASARRRSGKQVVCTSGACQVGTGTDVDTVVVVVVVVMVMMMVSRAPHLM